MMARTSAKTDPATSSPARIRAGTLLAAVKDAAAAVEGKNTIPILANLQLEADPASGGMRVTGTNLDAWVTRTCTGEGEREAGPGFTITLPAKALQAVLAEIDADAMVTLTPPSDGEARATLAAGRSRFRLHCLPADDFPALPALQVTCSFEMPCSGLADAFAAVEHAISNEETRYYLNGVYLHIWQDDGAPAQLRLAATDGHRLARLALEPPEGGNSWPSTIVARQTVALLDRLCGEAVKQADKEKGDRPTPVVLAEGALDAPGGMIRWSIELPDGEEVIVQAKTIDGSFPDYARVIPTASPHSAVISRSSLMEAVRRVAVIASDKTRAVKASFTTDKLELAVSSVELGEAREELPCSYAGPEICIGFNGQYWREALAALATDDVSLAFDTPGGPVLVRAVGAEGAEEVDRERLVQVLMPLRV